MADFASLIPEQIEAPPQIRIEQRPANPTPPRPHSASPAPEEVPVERDEDEYERLLNGPIEDIRRAAARDPTLGFFFRVLDDIKDQLLEGITAQIQVQENRQDTGVQTLNTTLQQMTNSISKLEASTGNIRQQVESAAQNAWTAANSSQLGVNEQIKTQNAIDKLSQQMDTIVVAMGAMGKQVSAALNKQEEAIKKLKADTETLQETLQVVEERVSNIDIMDQDHQWEPEAESSRAQVPKRPQGLFPGDNPPGPPSGPPSRGNTPPPRNPRPHRKEEKTKDEIPKGARAKKPEAFNGKRGQEAEIFLMKMEIYFNDYGTAFDNNRKMATFLTNMGEGEAAKWAKPLLRKILDEEPHEYLANWNALKNAFLLAFSDPMKKERAIQNIHKLQQTGSAQHYVTAFRTLMQELDWDEHALIDVFKKGLKIEMSPQKPSARKIRNSCSASSGIAIGAILSQRGEDGYLHPVAYLSKSYNDAQRNYDTANKELLAIVESLKHWRIYLEGTILPVTVFTDHRNLERWKNAETFNRRHARWHMELASFNFEIHYRPGKMSNKPDALSRRHDHEDIPNPQQIMINAERFKGFKANIEIDIISMIRESLSDDESLTTLIESTKKKEDLPPSIRKQYDKYEWKEDLLWYEGRIVIPENKEIRLAILEMHHDNPIAGHQGQARTLELISRRYYWPAMKQQVNRFVETCEICQRSKGHKRYAPQKPLPIPQKPWEDIAYDFIVKLPESQGMDSILVVIDRFSWQAHFIPCLESTNAEGVANLFIKEVWKLHGLPKTTVSDRGPTFNSQFLKALYAKLGINPKFSTAFHPETDGITERTNQWLEGFLRSFCNYRQDDWVRWLPIAEFCHNNQINSATGKTAFETIYGLHPRWDLVDLEVNAPNAADMADSMQEIWDEVIASMEFHRSKEDTPKHEYKIGDKVWLVGQNITTRRPSKKLDNKKLGPFVISEKISSHVYRLELPKTMRTHNVFHINLLTPFTEDKDFHRRQARPPPIVTEEGEEEYEVDHVVAWEQRKNGLYYQIRWKGYDPIEDTMERAEKIAELPQIMEDLLKRHPKAPVPKNYKHPGKEYKRTEGKASNLTTSYSSSPPNNQSQLTNSPNPFSLPWPPSAPTSLPRPPPSATIPVTLGSSSTTPPSHYQDAIRRCDSFIRSADYAKSLDPGLTLDYIPMAERWNCRWLATHTLQCPKRGNLYWVGKGPWPESDRAMQATKLFVIEEWVGSEVEHLVKEVQKVKKMNWYEDYTRTKDRNDRLIKKSINQFSTPHLIKRLEEWENQGKEKAVPKWVENSTEWWFRLSDIEEMKKEWMGSIGDKGQKMAIVARVVEEWCQAPDISKSYQEVLKEISFGEVVELAEKERWSKRELLDWLDQRAWDKGNEDLSVDMADLLLEPLDEDEEWVKLKEEVWGAEAPNGAGVYHPKDTEEF
ncbi:Retrotransposable element Tf2 protein [Ceratobasidium sp. AG-Ba]|nr:Retrotransposable element Tf2 protein [Ceratobasidium sp. AG-Ba]